MQSSILKFAWLRRVGLENAIRVFLNEQPRKSGLP